MFLIWFISLLALSYFVWLPFTLFSVAIGCFIYKSIFLCLFYLDSDYSMLFLFDLCLKTLLYFDTVWKLIFLFGCSCEDFVRSPHPWINVNGGVAAHHERTQPHINRTQPHSNPAEIPPRAFQPCSDFPTRNLTLLRFPTRILTLRRFPTRILNPAQIPQTRS